MAGRTYEASVILSDGQEVQVEYTAEGGSPRSGMSGPYDQADPGSLPEICINRAWLGADGEGGECVLSEAEEERICAHLSVTHEEPDYDDYD